MGRFGLGFVPGGTFVGQAASALGVAGDASHKQAKRVARKVHKTAAKHGHHSKHKGGGGHHFETKIGLPSIDLSGAAQGLAEHFGMGGAMAEAHAAAGGGHFGGGRRRRSINPANAKALRRSMRRLESFSKLAHRVMHFKTAHKLKTPRKGRR